MVTARRLLPGDWKLWRKLRLAALSEAPYAFCATLAEWQENGDTEERWRARLENVAFNAVALMDVEAVGMVGATLPAGLGPVELLSMWGTPAARGQGIGAALVSAVLRWAAEQGSDSVVLRVFEDNAHARALLSFATTGSPTSKHPS